MWLKRLWFKIRYFKILKQKDATLKIIINKMLKPYKIDYDHVIKNPMINGEPWFTYYTMTSDQYNKLKKFSINVLMINEGFTKDYAIKEFAWMNLMWGLKIKNNDND